MHNIIIIKIAIKYCSLAINGTLASTLECKQNIRRKNLGCVCVCVCMKPRYTFEE